MHIKKLYLTLLFLILGCAKNNPLVFKDFQALRCELHIKEKKYNDYIFNINNGYLYYYDEYKNEFRQKSQRFESDYFIENTSEITSFINKNNLIINNIEYYKDFNKNQKLIRTQEIINLKSLIIRSITKNKIGDYVVSRGKCIWIDPKLGIRY